MRIIIFIFFLLTLVALYLNRSYAAFFNGIKTANLKSPVVEREFVFGDLQNEKKKIIFFGDSLTSGVGAASVKNTIGYRVSEHFAKDSTVIYQNYGYPGAKVNDLLAYTDYINNQKPAAIFILIGINDIFNRTPLENYENDLDTLVTALDQQETEIYLLTIPFLGTPHSVPFPYDIIYNFRLTEFNKKIDSIALKHNLQTIDLYHLSRQTMNNPGMYSADHFHPSDNGYILLSEIITDELTK